MLPILTLCAAAILTMPLSSRAQDTAQKPAPAASPTRKTHATSSSSHTLPFRGTLTAVDTNAMTVTVGKRVFVMTSTTKVTKDGKPAELSEGVTGQPITGAYRKTADGKLDAVTIHFGGPEKSSKKKPAKN
ncbi:MAG TPA: hypothetical protein VFY06_10025 [Verrucomicrobiae bacterium]|nr:hypothetical protein [Verrucomicrobiae bacterium]